MRSGLYVRDDGQKDQGHAGRSDEVTARALRRRETATATRHTKRAEMSGGQEPIAATPSDNARCRCIQTVRRRRSGFYAATRLRLATRNAGMHVCTEANRRNICMILPPVSDRQGVANSSRAKRDTRLCTFRHPDS